MQRFCFYGHIVEVTELFSGFMTPEGLGILFYISFFYDFDISLLLLMYASKF